MPLEPDTKIITLLTDLQACLCSELTPEGEDRAPLCLCVPVPGAFPGHAYAGQGNDVAWVRLADYFPSNTPGVQAPLPFSSANGRTLLIEMGVVRCHAVPERLEYDEDLLTEIWTAQMRDLGAMERALACCTGRSWDANQFVIGNYRAIGLEGDMAGGMLSIAMQIE